MTALLFVPVTLFLISAILGLSALAVSGYASAFLGIISGTFLMIGGVMLAVFSAATPGAVLGVLLGILVSAIGAWSSQIAYGRINAG